MFATDTLPNPRFSLHRADAIVLQQSWENLFPIYSSRTRKLKYFSTKNIYKDGIGKREIAPKPPYLLWTKFSFSRVSGKGKLNVALNLFFD